jgi:nucleoside-diphosphate-sugar epimerase
MRKKTLLIIGGTGFFGKSILNFIIKNKLFKKYSLIIFSRKAKLLKLGKNNHLIKRISGDIQKAKTLPKADLVIYCSLLKNLKSDILSVKNYFSLAKKIHFSSKILYVSSGAVYGELPKKSVTENYNNITKYKSNNYKKYYSRAKIVNEKKFQELGRLGVNVSIARCFSFVGEHLSYKKYAIKDFIDSILLKRPIYIKSNYEVIRSYLHADDLSKFLLKILKKSSSSCPVYNCGSDDAISIRELGKRLALKYNLKFKEQSIDKNNLDYYVPNINKFRKEFKFYKKLNSYYEVIKTINKIKKNFIKI